MKLPLPLVSTLAVLALAAPARLPAVDFYVAPQGNDTHPGTLAQPFATLERARAAVRNQLLPSNGPRTPVTVWLRAGNYLRTNALELNATDSGTALMPITWRAYGEERARLLGGVILPTAGDASVAASTPPPTSVPGPARSWQPVSEPAIRARLDPAAQTNVLQLALHALGLTGFGEMKSRGFGRPTTTAHSELFFGGRPMVLARWPNEGTFEKIAGFPASAGKGDEHGGSIGDLPGGFSYTGDRPKHWQDVSDLWVHGYWSWDWANSYERVTTIDREIRLIKTAPPHGLYGFRKGQRFHFLNVLEELDQPGEWYLERKTGVLYFWPPGGGKASGNDAASKPASAAARNEAVLSLLDQPLVRFSDASFVQFRGLTFEATRSSAVEIHGGAGIRISGCRIQNIGDYGVVVDGGAQHVVEGCDVIDTGDGGVSLTGGNRQTLEPGLHVVDNCHLQRQGRWSKCYVPAVLMNGVGLRASHNHIHDHPHCAILFNGNDHLIEFNDIHHIALETGDVGAIYAGRDYTFRGNRIRHNYVHETGGVGMGSMGVYMDDCVSGTEVFGNIFYKVHWAMFIGGGRDHRVENNVFVECDPAVRVDGRGLDPSPVWHKMVFDYMRQQLAVVPAELYRQKYPAIREVDRFYADPNSKGIPPENNVVARNVCAGKWLEVGWRASQEILRLENNLVGTTALFVDVAHQDFRLPADSAAWGLGFKEIPIRQIGLQDDALRRGLPPAPSSLR